jgi:two-component system, sensor histidine kinase and response regulator
METEVRRAHILVVDDNRLIRSVVAIHLRDRGYEVSEASNGAQAIELVRTTAFDAVLMDLQMPVMDGVSATQVLRSEAAYEALPIFAFTGQPQSLGANRSLFTDVLVKPMAPDEILDVICHSLPELV